MMREDLTIDEFLSRVRHMPDEEAVEQIEMRRDRCALELNLITTERAKLAGKKGRNDEYDALGREHFVMCTDNGRLTRALKEAKKRLDDASMNHAVLAVFGEEGYAKVRLWRAQNNPMHQVGSGDLTILMRKAGML